MTRKDTLLKVAIIDVVDAYENAVGAVPLQLLTYHVNHHPKYGGHDYTQQEIEYTAEELRASGRLTTSHAYNTPKK